MPAFHSTDPKSVQSIPPGSSFRHLFWFAEESEGSSAKADAVVERMLPFYETYGTICTYTGLNNKTPGTIQTFAIASQRGEEAYSAFMIFSDSLGKWQRPLIEQADLVLSEQIEIVGTTYKPVKMLRPTTLFNPHLRILFDSVQPLFIF